MLGRCNHTRSRSCMLSLGGSAALYTLSQPLLRPSRRRRRVNWNRPSPFPSAMPCHPVAVRLVVVCHHFEPVTYLGRSVLTRGERRRPSSPYREVDQYTKATFVKVPITSCAGPIKNPKVDAEASLGKHIYLPRAYPQRRKKTPQPLGVSARFRRLFDGGRPNCTFQVFCSVRFILCESRDTTHSDSAYIAGRM